MQSQSLVLRHQLEIHEIKSIRIKQEIERRKKTRIMITVQTLMSSLKRQMNFIVDEASPLYDLDSQFLLEESKLQCLIINSNDLYLNLVSDKTCFIKVSKKLKNNFSKDHF